MGIAALLHHGNGCTQKGWAGGVCPQMGRGCVLTNEQEACAYCLMSALAGAYILCVHPCVRQSRAGKRVQQQSRLQAPCVGMASCRSKQQTDHTSTDLSQCLVWSECYRKEGGLEGLTVDISDEKEKR